MMWFIEIKIEVTLDKFITYVTCRKNIIGKYYRTDNCN